MAVSVASSGSVTPASAGTETDLATVTTAGVYQLAVDAANLVDGDVVFLRVYGKARSADTERLLYVSSFAHTQAAPLKHSPAIPTAHYLRFTLTQAAGTMRAFPWAVSSL
ncbi:hypothetical protein [Paracraurococcus ruber]|uniref:Uncharacterized protein n=1 Tax=Paracraurococcus ruber TaxID=77675 RepID=A0ABS1CR57_9PROT|nr:hypothetical protein [Paracraurococcus ruber]MBK1656833.1 hypothetical protein [Paracraurococcus ruber]TDG33948.1 hypothetical protein E2C05_01525 [Paracraurococcus ruber]